MVDDLWKWPPDVLDRKAVKEAAGWLVTEAGNHGESVEAAVDHGVSEGLAMAAVAGYLSTLPRAVGIAAMGAGRPRALEEPRLATLSSDAVRKIAAALDRAVEEGPEQDFSEAAESLLASVTDGGGDADVREAVGYARGVRAMKAAADTHARMAAEMGDGARWMGTEAKALSEIADMLLRRAAADARDLAADDAHWISVREPGGAFERVGPYTRKTIAGPLRRLMSSRPAAHLAVMSVGPSGPEMADGPAFLSEIDERGLEHAMWHARASVVAQSRIALAADLPPEIRKPALLSEVLRQAESMTGYLRPGAPATQGVEILNGCLRKLDLALHALAEASVAADALEGEDPEEVG